MLETDVDVPIYFTPFTIIANPTRIEIVQIGALVYFGVKITQFSDFLCELDLKLHSLEVRHYFKKRYKN